MPEWFETEPIYEMNEFMEKHFRTTLSKEWYDVGGIHYLDFKHEVGRWIEDIVSLLQELQEMVDDLPDDEVDTYPDCDTLEPTITKEEVK